MADISVVNTETESVSPKEGGTTDAVVARDTELNIYQRIHKIMSEVGHIEKDGTIQIGNSSYDYITHDAVTASIRGAFVRHGVMVLPTTVGSVVNGNRTELTVRVRFINIDEPAQFIDVETIGYGVDSSDKGPGKALSYAVKYAYLKLLMLNSADDIEADNTTHEPGQPTANQQLAAEHQDVEKQSEWAATFRAALQNAKSPQEIDRLRRDNKTMFNTLPDVTRKYFADLIEARKDEFKDAEEA